MAGSGTDERSKLPVEMYLLAGGVGFVFGALVSFANAQITRHSVRKNSANAIMAASILRMLVNIAALAVVCTGFGYTLQPVAQSRIDANRASLFCALSPAFANVFGAMPLHERITGLGALGMALILGSILPPHLLPAGKNTAPAANKE